MKKFIIAIVVVAIGTFASCGADDVIDAFTDDCYTCTLEDSEVESCIDEGTDAFKEQGYTCTKN